MILIQVTKSKFILENSIYFQIIQKSICTLTCNKQLTCNVSLNLIHYYLSGFFFLIQAFTNLSNTLGVTLAVIFTLC